MTCPECKAAGKQSRVQDRGSEQTCIGFFPYEDEAGLYHIHDPNQNVSYYLCSRGHEFKRTWYHVCPGCGWTAESRWAAASDNG